MNYTEKRLELFDNTTARAILKVGDNSPASQYLVTVAREQFKTSIEQAVTEERERMVGLIEEIRGMRDESNEALDYLQDRIEKDLLSSLDKPSAE